MFSLTKNLIEAYEGKYFSKKFIRNGFLCIKEKMLSPDFKGAFFFLNSSLWAAGWFRFVFRKRFKTTANTSCKGHNKIIKLKDTLTLNNFSRVTLLNIFFF